jgi:hypothetical protein
MLFMFFDLNFLSVVSLRGGASEPQFDGIRPILSRRLETPVIITGWFGESFTYTFISCWMTPSAEIFIVRPKDRGWRHISSTGQYGPSKQVPPGFILYTSTLSCRLKRSTMAGSTGCLVLCGVKNMVKSDWYGKSCKVCFLYGTMLTGRFHRKHLGRKGMVNGILVSSTQYTMWL